MRRAAKTDDAAGEIVKAGEDEGWECYDVRLPCDKIFWHPVLDVLQWAEIKTRAKSGRIPVDKRQEGQLKFLAYTSCPIVTSPQELLELLRSRYPHSASPEVIALAHKIRKDFERDWNRDGAAASAAQRAAA